MVTFSDSPLVERTLREAAAAAEGKRNLAVHVLDAWPAQRGLRLLEALDQVWLLAMFEERGGGVDRAVCNEMPKLPVLAVFYRPKGVFFMPVLPMLRGLEVRV